MKNTVVMLASSVAILFSASSIAADSAGLALAQKSGCLACHGVNQKIVGPAYQDVYAKYKGDAKAEAKLVAKVKNGGSGVWGPIPMPANSAVKDSDIQTIVKWILSGAK